MSFDFRKCKYNGQKRESLIDTMKKDGKFTFVLKLLEETGFDSEIEALEEVTLFLPRDVYPSGEETPAIY